MVLQTEFFHEVQAILNLDFAFIGVTQVGSIAYEIAYDIFFSVIFNFLFPAPDILEWGWICDVVDQDDCVTTLVKYPGYISEWFLSGRIPYLQLN